MHLRRVDHESEKPDVRGNIKLGNFINALGISWIGEARGKGKYEMEAEVCVI